MDEVSFLLAGKHKRFLQVDIITLSYQIIITYQITQNNKFAISLQYLKKNVKDEVDFLLAD